MAASSEGPMALPPQFFRRTYLFLLTLLAGIYTVTAILAPTPYVEVPLGLLVLLFVPGYAIGALAFGARPRWPWSLTFAIVVGLSVAFNVAVGFGLLYFKLGLPAPAFGFAALILLMAASFVWVVTQPVETGSRFTRFLGEEFRLPDHTPAQRAIGYALFLSIVFAIALIVVIGSMFPASPGNLSLGLAGPSGTTADLPVNGSIGTIHVNVYTIEVLIVNDKVAQQVNVSFFAAIAPTNTTHYKFVSWGNSSAPINLTGPERAVTSLSLNASASATQKVHFFFGSPFAAGNWIFQFVLSNSAGTELRSASWTMSVS